MDKATIIVPAYNEEKRIGDVVRGLQDCCPDDRYHVLVVDDGSTDHTNIRATRAGAAVLRRAENRGVGAAIRYGMVTTPEDIIVVFAGDGQHNPCDVGRLVRKLDEGFEFVQGNRYLPGARNVDQPLLSWLGCRIHSILFGILVGRHCGDPTNGIRAFRKGAVLAAGGPVLFSGSLDRYGFETYLRSLAMRSLRYSEIPVTVTYHGSSKMRPVRDWLDIFRPVLVEFMEMRRKFFKYLAVGASAFAMEVFTFWLMLRLLPIGNQDLLVVAANVISIGVTAAYNFTMQMRFTFGVGGHVGQRLLYFLGLVMFNKMAQSALLVAANHASMPAVPAKIVVVTAAALCNYMIYKHLVFRGLQ